MSQLSCKVEIPEGQELEVGSHFALNCEGEWPAGGLDAKSNSLELRLDPADKYKLRLLQFQKESPGSGRLLVTSYQAGEHQLKAVQLVDHEQSVLLGDVSFTVKSSLNPTEPESEPYGPIGSVGVHLPLWYFLFAAGIVVLISGVIWFRVRQKVLRRRQLLMMDLESSPLEAMAQLSQKIRGILRELHQGKAQDVVHQLDLAFRFYFARRFAIPTQTWKLERILKIFKVENPDLADEIYPELQETFTELERARASVEKMQHRDLEQLVQLVRTCSEKIEKQSRPASKKSGGT